MVYHNASEWKSFLCQYVSLQNHFQLLTNHSHKICPLYHRGKSLLNGKLKANNNCTWKIKPKSLKQIFKPLCIWDKSIVYNPMLQKIQPKQEFGIHK